MPALLARLKKGDIIAALDVFDREPLEKTSPLRALPNAYLTPHRAGGLRESVVRILTGLTDDFEAWLKRKPRKLTVTKQMLASLG
jgi:phosphoglycerate dehydrogenase-like enzyme